MADLDDVATVRGSDRAGRRSGDSVADACGIVLAGGRATRFGRDKLDARVGSRSLLSLAVETLSSICDEVIVTVAPDYRPRDLPANARAVVDAAPFGGPLLGLLSGARATERERLLVVGGDMPTLVPDVLRQLLAALSGPQHEVAVLGLGRSDEPQPLPLALKRRSLLERHLDHESMDGRSLRWLLDRLDLCVVPDSVWRRADPMAQTLRDVDRPEDLADLRSS